MKVPVGQYQGLDLVLEGDVPEEKMETVAYNCREQLQKGDYGDFEHKGFEVNG